MDIPRSAQTDLGLKHYLAAVEPPTQLNLSFWQVTDVGLKELAGLKFLRKLNLEFTKVTDSGLKELARLNHLRSLKLFGTLVTDEGLMKLDEALPGCQIPRSP